MTIKGLEFLKRIGITNTQTKSYAQSKVNQVYKKFDEFHIGGRLKRIPGHLLQYSIERNLIAEVRLYLFFRFMYGTKFQFGIDEMTEACDIFKIDAKAYDDLIKKLVELNWVEIDFDSGGLIVSTFSFLQKKLKLTRQTGFYIKPKILISVEEFIGFTVGACLHMHIDSVHRSGKKLDKFPSYAFSETYIRTRSIGRSDSQLGALLGCSSKNANDLISLALQFNFLNGTKEPARISFNKSAIDYNYRALSSNMVVRIKNA